MWKDGEHLKVKTALVYLFLALFLIGEFGCQKPNIQPYSRSSNLQRPIHVSNQNLSPLLTNKTWIARNLNKYLISNHINGSVAVIKNKSIIFNEGVGYSNIKKGLYNQPSTTYPIASITKVFVATSILQLQERGKLNISDPVSKYIPHFPNGEKIKLYHLLTHTSGIKPPIWHIGDQTSQDLIKEIVKRHVNFSPGKKWDYKDANYMVLGYVVEKASRISLHQYIQQNIFNKAHMKASGFITEDHPVPFNSIGYLKGPKHLYPLTRLNIPMLFGCGDVYSTAYDLSLFDQALMERKLLSEKSLNEMLTHGPHSIYGLGLYNNGEMIYSRGVIGGWESFHVIFKDQTFISLLLNIRDQKNNVSSIVNNIHRIVMTTKSFP